ncbi:MAG: hypothetical protein U0Q16_09185 [Bryobacteraceae bacterium]
MAITSVKVQEDFATWQAPGRSKPIVYSVTLLNELSRQATRAYESFPNGGSEIGGVLFGSVDEDEIRITSSRDVSCEYRYGPCFVLSPSDEETLQRVIGEAASDPDLRGLIPVGWYHTHTRSPIAMTPEDARVWNRYFPHPWQVALILRPQRDEPTRGGFFFRPDSGPARLESSYRVFETELQNLPAPAIHKLAMAVRNPPEPKEAEPEEDVPDEMLWHPPQASRWRRMVVPAAAVIAVAAAAAGIYSRVGGGRPRPTLALKLVERSGQLRAMWDPSSPVILHAERGSIEIQNGNDKTRLPLHPELLRTGTLPILRPQGDVEVTLEVEAPDLDMRDGPIREVARYIAGEVASPRGTKDIGSLREELARLQGDLASQSANNSEIENRIQTLRKQPGAPQQQTSPPAPPTVAEKKKPEPPKPAEIKSAADSKAEAAKLQAEIARLRREEQERLLARETAAAKDRAAKAEKAKAEQAKADQSKADQAKADQERIARDRKTQDQRQQEMAAKLVPPPQPTAPVEQAPAPAPAPVAATPAPPPAEAAAPVYTGPRRGRLIWSGYLAPNGSLTINGRNASSGTVNGALPGVPVRVSAFPAEFSRGGLSVYSANQQLAQQEVVESRSAQNGWMNTRYQYDPARARSVQVSVPPSAGSGNRQVQLRGGDQAVSVIVIDWEVLK